ncbi:hypothetical protein ACFXAZ_25430 [Streptomyces sp. NPDC059477]
MPQLTGVTTIEVTVAPTRVEYAAFSRAGRTPATTAFLATAHIPATPDTE